MNLRHLDILRASLALMVLIGHARMMLWTGWQDWQLLPHAWWEWVIAVGGSAFRFGHQAVIVFFALSGFFIHLRAAQDASRDFSARDYLRRRARRILPPYYAVLLFTVLLDGIGQHWFPILYQAQTGSVLLDSNFRDSGYPLTSVLPALLAQPGLLGVRFGSNGPLWSICNEVCYYLIYPLFIQVWLRSRWLAYGASMGAGMLCWFYPIAGWWSGILAAYPMWLAGALVAELLSSVWFGSRSHWGYWLLSCGAALGSLAGIHLLPEANPICLFLNMLMGASAIVAFERMPFAMAKPRLGRMLEWLGVRSYSLYIFHFPVLALLSAWCIQTYGGRPAHGWLALLGVVLSISAGLIGFVVIERRFLSPQRSL